MFPPVYNVVHETDISSQEKEQTVGTDLTGMFRGTSLRTKAI